MAKSLLETAFENMGVAKKQYENQNQQVVGQKHDLVGGNPAGVYNHGNGGLFSRPGQQPQIFSLMMLPQSEFFDSLPVIKDRYAESVGAGGQTGPLNTVITGVTTGAGDSVSNQPTGACDPGPEGGMTKICTFTHPFGCYSGSVKLNLENVGLVRDLADPMYLQLVNNPAQMGTSPALFNPTLGATANILTDEFARRLFESVTSYKRMLAQRVWIGSPANSAGSANWADIVGMQTLINAGNKRDYYSSAVCTAADSDIKNFNYGIVNPNNAAPSALIYQYLDTMFHYLTWNARRMGLAPAQIDLVINPNLWDELTKVWPIAQYLEALATMASTGGAGGVVNVNASDMNELRDQMRADSVLPLRGQMVRVIQDDTIPELDSTNDAHLAAGQYASDIYYICRSVVGGIPTSYIDPFDMGNRLMEQVVSAGRQLNTFVSDGGLFRWYTYEQGPCLQWSYKAKWRIMQHATQLCGRIQNVGYQPIQHVPSWNPSSDYFKNGGVTTVPQSSYYVDWQATRATF
jgi:hypothetical protein